MGNRFLMQLMIFLPLVASGSVANAQMTTIPTKTAATAVKNAFRPEPTFERHVASASRLDAQQLAELLKESPSAQRLNALLASASTPRRDLPSQLECEHYLPLEPGEVSYFLGTRVQRVWLNNVDPEIRARDELQCAFCEALKSETLSPQEREDDEKMLIDMLSGFVEYAVDHDLRLAPPPTGEDR